MPFLEILMFLIYYLLLTTVLPRGHTTSYSLSLLGIRDTIDMEEGSKRTAHLHQLIVNVFFRKCLTEEIFHSEPEPADIKSSSYLYQR